MAWTRMEGILAGIAVCFRSSSEASCITTVPQTAIQLNGALQHTTLKQTRNGDFVTSTRSSCPFVNGRCHFCETQQIFDLLLRVFLPK